MNFYSLLCTDSKIILIILSSGNTRYLSYIGMNHDWWLIDHEWWFVVSDCDCDCPESDFEFLVLLALKHSFTVRLLTLRDLYRHSIFDIVDISFYITLHISHIYSLYYIPHLIMSQYLYKSTFLFVCFSPITNIFKIPLLFFFKAFIDNRFVKLLWLLVNMSNISKNIPLNNQILSIVIMFIWPENTKFNFVLMRCFYLLPLMLS